MKVSMVVSTYNRPETLNVCLESIRNQTVLPDEVVICDDGSGKETIELIERKQKDFPIPIVHAWQEDDGFRKSMAMNRGIALALGEYVIEIDGDIFIHSRCVEDHMTFAEKGYYIKGGRINLGRKLTERVCRAGVPRRIYPWSRGIESKSANAIRFLPLSRYLAPRYRKNKSPLLGCNTSFFREDFIRINGYDEFFEGWGGEDWDLGLRLQRSGLKKKYVKFAALACHLWHEDKYMYNREKNVKYQVAQDERQVIRCRNGIDKYL